MTEASPFPAIDAALNATATTLLVAGYVCIRRRRVAAHRACMLAAFAASVAFLGCYLWYHFTPHPRMAFGGSAAVRWVYVVVLVSHIVLAAAVVPLALTTLFLGWRGRFDRHLRWARWTLPIWLYVSATGVLVYFMLYRWYPGTVSGV
jgi:putative membrane protein